MPNWCNNYAKISHHDTAMIDGIEEELNKENNGLFNMLRPNPTGEWQYDWSCENWGTKWDAGVYNFSREDDNTITIGFDTAWGPPCELYSYMVHELGYDVDAYYMEEGMCFAGHYCDGEDDYREYGNLSADEIAEQLGDIDEYWGISDRIRENEEEQEYEDWISSCEELEKTEWYPAKIKPVEIGVYETQSDAWPYPNKSYWDGEQWCFYDFSTDSSLGKLMNKVTQWRGITAEASLEAILPTVELDE